MQIVHEHPWEVEPKEGVQIQRELREHIITKDRLGRAETVAGVDVSVKDGRAIAAVVTLAYPELMPQQASLAERPVEMPYIPGLLSFREAPAILEALDKLPTLPDLLIFDGQGMAHPRRMGIATHMGVILDHPTVGCAKSRLCGEYEMPPVQADTYTLLRDNGEVIGAVVRTRTNVKPVFVSIGHRVDLETAIDYVLGCCTRYKLPETTRWAHKVAGGADVPPAVDLYI
jgi:deoxyribonuclease V